MTSSAPVRGSNSLSRITFSVRQALSRARQGMLHGQVLPQVGVLDPAGERSLEQLALGGVLRRVAVPRDPAARERFVQQWLKENEARVKAGGLASTLLLPAFLTLSTPVQAAAPKVVPLAGQPGVVSVTVESDGSVRLELADGRSLALEANAVVIVDGAVFGDAQVLAQLGLSGEGAAPLVAVAGLDGVASVTTQADGSALVTMVSGAQRTLPPEAIEVREGVVYAPEPALTALPPSGGSEAGEGFSPALGLLALGVLGAAAAAGGGGGSGGTQVVTPEPPPPPPPEPETASGFVIDGYLSGATVTRGDSTVTTDENGGYSDLGGDPNAPIIARGGVDISTGQNFTGTLTAPAGSTVVTPLTTLVQSLVEQGETVESAVKAVQTALGLPDSVGDSAGEQSILNFDPVVAAASEDPEVAALALSVARAGIQVASVLKNASAGDAEEFSRLADSLALEIATAPLDLGSAVAVETFLTKAGASEEVIASAATIAEGASAIAAADSLDAAAAAQKAANADVPGVVPEDAEAPEAPVLNAVPSLVTGAGLDLTGTAVGADQVTIVLRGLGGVLTRSATVEGDAFSFTLTGEALSALGQGAATLQVTALSNASPAASAPVQLTFTVDTAADTAPAVTLVFGDALITAGEAEAVSFTLTGLDADATAVVTFSDGTNSTSVTVPADGSGAVDLSGFNDGTITSSITITDAAGNSASLSGGTTVLGLTDPANAVLTAAETLVGAAGLGAVGYALTGLPEGATAVVTFTDGTGAVSATRTTNGEFTVDLSALKDGAVSSSMTVTTAVGVSAEVAGPAVTLDRVVDSAPAASLSLGEAVVNAEEASAVSFTVTGLDADASAVATFTDGTDTVSATVKANGAAAVDLSSLADGAVTSSLALTDAAGNTATVAGPSLTLDTTADAAPTATLSIADTVVTAEDASAVSFTVAGLDADATAAASFTDGEKTVTVAVAADGSGTVDLSSLADGAVTSSLAITDTAGNTAKVAGTTVSLAQTPKETAAVVALDTTLVGSAEAVELAFDVAGLTAAESAVVVFSDGTDSVSVSVTANGASTVDVSGLEDGSISVSLRVERGDADPVTVEGPTFTLDTVADAAPSATLTVAGSTIAAAAAGSVSFTVAGLDDDATAVASFTDGVNTVTAAVSANGTSTINLASLNKGAVTSSLAITDEAGNTAQSTGPNFTLAAAPVAPPAADETAPGTPVVGFATQTGTSETRSSDKTLSITAEAGATVEVFINGSSAGNATESSTAGVYTFEIDLADGDFTAAAQATDAAGNVGTKSTAKALTLDTTAPDAPVLSLTEDTGRSDTDFITSNGSITVAGLEAGSTFEFSVNSGTTYTAGEGSSFSVIAGSYAEGQVRVRQTDAAGNVSAEGQLTGFTVDDTFVVDQTAPSAVITFDAATVAVGATLAGEITFNEAPLNFSSDDLTLPTGMSIESLAVKAGSDGKVYTLVLSAVSNEGATESATVTLGVAFEDRAGNAPTETVSSPAFAITETDRLIVGGDPESGVVFETVEAALLASAAGNTLRLEGDAYDLTNLSEAAVLAWQALGAIEVATDATVTLTAAQATDQSLTAEGAGSLVVTGLDGTAFDFSNVSVADGTGVIQLAAANVTANSATNFGGLSVAVDAGETLTASGAQLSGKAVSGDGSVVITAFEATLDANYAGLNAATVTASQSGTITFTGTLGGVALSQADGAALTLSAETANGATINTASGTSSVTVTAVESVLDADFSGLTASTVSGEVTTAAAAAQTFIGELGGMALEVAGDGIFRIDSGVSLATASVDIGAGAEFQATTAQLAALGAADITGAGTLLVTDFAADTDLSAAPEAPNLVARVGTSVDVTANINLGKVDGYRTATGAELTATAAQINGVDVTGTGSLAISGLFDFPAADLSGVASTLAQATAAVSANLNFTGTLGDVQVALSENAELTLSGASADGATITGAGSVVVTDLTANADFSGLANTPATGAAIAATAANSLTFSGTLNGATVSVPNDVTLTLGADANLGGATFDVANGGTLSLSAEVLDGSVTLETPAGQAGAVAVSDVDDAADFTNVDADLVVTATLAASTNLDLTATGARFDNVDAFTVPAGSTLTLTAAQADGLTISGAGSVTITEIEDTPAADLSGVTATGRVVAVESDVDLSGNGSLGTPSFAVAKGVTLTLAKDTLGDGKITAISGDGALALTGAAAELTGLGAGITVSEVDLSALTGDLGSAFAFGAVTTLKVSPAQAAGTSFNGGDASETLVIDYTDNTAFPDTFSGTLDLEGVNLGAGDDTVTLDFGEASDADDATDPTVTLTGTINFGDGIDLFEVFGGAVSLTGASLEDLENTQFNSKIILSANSFKALVDAIPAGVGQFLGSGSLEIPDFDSITIDLTQVARFVPGGISKPTINFTAGEANVKVYTSGGAASDDTGFEGLKLVVSESAADELEITGATFADGDGGGFTEGTVSAAEITSVTVFGQPQLEVALAAAAGEGSAIESIVLARFVGTTKDLDFTALPSTVSLDFQNTLGIYGPGQVVTVGLAQALGQGTNRFYALRGAELNLEVGANPVADLGGTAPSNSVLFNTFPPYDTTLVVDDDSGSNTVMDVTGLSVQRGWKFELADGETLRITDSQFTGKTVNGTGAVEVALSDQSYASLVNANNNLTISATAAGDINFFGNLAGANVTVADGASLALYGVGTVLGSTNVALASGATAGALELNYFGTASAEDLSGNTIDDGITKTAKIMAPVRFSFTGDFGSFGVQVSDGATLVASGDTLAGVTVAGDGDGVGRPSAVEITGVTAAEDFSGISTDKALVILTGDGDVDFSAGGALPSSTETTLRVDAGVTLTIDAAKLDGVIVLGEGAVALTGLDGSADLSGLRHTGGTSIALTEDTNLSTLNLGDVPFALSIAADKTLTLTAAQADGRTITGDGSVVVTAPAGAPEADLSGITAGATLTVTDDQSAAVFRGDLGSATVSIGAAGAFAIAATSASGATITNAGSLTVTSLAQAPTGDFSNLSGVGTATAVVTGNVNFTGDLGPLALSIADGASVTAAGSVLNGVDASGGGNLVVTGLGSALAADLGGLQADLVFIPVTGASTFTGTLPVGALLSVAGGSALTASAAKLSGVLALGPGTVTVTDLTSTSDLSLLRSGTVTAEVSSGTVDLSGARLGVSVLNIANGATVTLTARQVNGRTITGDGTLRITETAAVEGRDDTGIAETITVFDTAPKVTLDVLGTEDVIGAAAAEDGVIVSGTVTDAFDVALGGQLVTLAVGSVSFVAQSESDGSFSVTVPLSAFLSVADGAASVTARAVQNGSAGEATRSFTLKLEAPAAPTVALDTDTGASDSDGISSNGTVNVTLEEGTTWAYSVDGGSTFTDGTGSSFTLAEGSYAAGQIQVRQTDVVGNASPLGRSTQAFVIDQTAPAKPVVSLTSDSGTAGDGISNEAVLGITAEAGSAVVVSIDGVAGPTASATDVSGVYTTDLSDTLEDGTFELTAVATDPAGNSSAVSTPFGLTLDTTAPANPTINAVGTDGEVGAAAAAAGVAVSGTAEAGLTVRVTWAGVTQTAVADLAGEWSTTFAAANVPADGIYTITVAAVVDKAGNSSAAGASTSVTVDRGDASPGLTLLNADSTTLQDLLDASADLQTLLGTGLPLSALASERQADFLGDWLANGPYESGASALTAAEPLYAYRVLLETLKDIAEKGSQSYGDIDFSSSAATSVKSVISALSGLSVDGTTVTATQVSSAIGFLTNMEALRGVNPTAFNAIAEFAIALNVAGTVTDVPSFRTALENLEAGLPAGQSFAFADLTLSKTAVGFYLTAFDGLARGEDTSSQLIMAGPFLDGDDRPTFASFSNPGELLKTAFLNGLINQANLVGDEIRDRIPESFTATRAEFEALNAQVAGGEGVEQGLLQKLRDGVLTLSDFQRASAEGELGPVESLEELLKVAEELGSLSSEFSDLTARFAGTVVQASQVTRGIALFEAFAFDTVSGSAVAVDGRSPFAGEQVLLDAMNSPTGLLLLTDQAGAARAAVEAALKAEYQALAEDGTVSSANEAKFLALKARVDEAIDDLPADGDLLAYLRVVTVLEADGSEVADLEALSTELQSLLGDQLLSSLGAERKQDLLQDLLDNAGDGYASQADFLADATALFAYRDLLETLKDIASAETPDYSQIDFSSTAPSSVKSVISAMAGLSIDGTVASAEVITDALAFLGDMEALRSANVTAFDAVAEFAIALNLGTVTNVSSFRDALANLEAGLPTGQSFAFSDLSLSKEAVGFYLTAFDGLKRGDNTQSQEIMAAPFLDGADRPTFANFSNPGELLKTAFLDGLINQAALVGEEIRSRIAGSEDLSSTLKASLTSDFETLFGVVAGTETAEGLLHRLKAGTLSLEDFLRDPTSGRFGPVESLEQLLLTAEELGNLAGFSDLTAAFAGTVVQASQVTRGIALFEAFAFDTVSGSAVAVDGRSPFAGEQVLLDAMNSPTGLLLLTDQAGAARAAVEAALKAELAALGEDGELTPSELVAFSTLANRVASAIDDVSNADIFPGVALKAGTAGDDWLYANASSGDEVAITVGGDGDDLIFWGGPSDTVMTGGAGSDWFVFPILGDIRTTYIGGDYVVTDFSRSDGDLDRIAVAQGGTEFSVGSAVLYDDNAVAEGSDVGLYVLSTLDGTGSTAEQVAQYLSESALFDDEGDFAYVLAPNLETADEDDALLLQVSSDSGTVSPDDVQVSASFSTLDFAELSSQGGDDIFFVWNQFA